MDERYVAVLSLLLVLPVMYGCPNSDGKTIAAETGLHRHLRFRSSPLSNAPPNNMVHPIIGTVVQFSVGDNKTGLLRLTRFRTSLLPYFLRSKAAQRRIGTMVQFLVGSNIHGYRSRGMHACDDREQYTDQGTAGTTDHSARRTQLGHPA